MTTSTPGRLGLIGDPVEHSLSPAFQQAALDALGIKVRYELLHTPAREISKRLDELRSGEFIGVNVTVPHKEVFFAAVDERSDIAKRVGAVNTVSCVEGRLLGDNTDVHGFVSSLEDAGFPFDGSQAIVLGAGGAARAVVVGLLQGGVERVVIANRTIERAQAIVADLAEPRLFPVTLHEVREHAAQAALIVNATSLGWQNETLPVDRSIFGSLPAGAVAYDLTYKPTAFLSAARESGVETVDGFSMLVHQGARSFEIWTGHKAPLDVMWAAASAARS